MTAIIQKGSSLLSNKEVVELRIKCLESCFVAATKNSLDKGDFFTLAEKAWEFAIKPLANDQKPTPQPPVGSESDTPQP